MEQINLSKSKSEEIFPEKLLMDMTPRTVDPLMFQCFSDEIGWSMDKINEFSLTSSPSVRGESEGESSMSVPENVGLRAYLVSVWNGFWKRRSKKNLLEKKNKNAFNEKTTAVEITSV